MVPYDLLSHLKDVVNHGTDARDDGAADTAASRSGETKWVCEDDSKGHRRWKKRDEHDVGEDTSTMCNGMSRIDR